MNTKVDALIQMSLANVFESAKRFKDRFQTIFIFDKVDILSIDSKSSANSKSEVNLYQRVQLVNQMNRLIASSWVEFFWKKCWVELRSWT